jgi:hypothetical protein
MGCPNMHTCPEDKTTPFIEDFLGRHDNLRIRVESSLESGIPVVVFNSF